MTTLPTDTQYQHLPRPQGGVAHAYGPQVHLLSHPWPMSLLARLCHPETTQPAVDTLVSTLYDLLLGEVASRLLVTEQVRLPTRMAAAHPEAGTYGGERLDPTQRVVVVDIARAGTLPAHRLYHGLHAAIDAASLRQDHVVASRQTNDAGEVVGVALSAEKIGGSVAGATVLVPDPMAATGTSVAAVLRRYQQAPEGPPRAIGLIHLIVTPEYVRRIQAEFPEAHIFAVRLDRGLSAPEVLATPPGARWDEERGLNDIQYIVPGAGGVGELLNNAWI